MSVDIFGRETETRCRWDAIYPVSAWVMLFLIYFFWVPENISSLKLPGPEMVYRSFLRVFPDLLRNAGATTLRSLLGFAIGAITGVFSGFALFYSRRLYLAAFLLIECIRPCPPIALSLFFFLWFGLNPIGPIILVSLAVWLMFVIATRESLVNVDIEIRRAAYSLGLRGFDFARFVLLPSIMVSLQPTARLSMALAIATTTGAEILGCQSGLGFLMSTARRTLHTETILLCMVILAVLSVCCDISVRLCLKKLTPWTI